MTTPNRATETEEVVESVWKVIHPDWAGTFHFSQSEQKKLNKHLRSKLTTLIAETEGRAIQKCIDMSDTIEVQHQTSMDEWRAFKGFRNAMRDYLQTLTNHTV